MSRADLSTASGLILLALLGCKLGENENESETSTSLVPSVATSSTPAESAPAAEAIDPRHLHLAGERERTWALRRARAGRSRDLPLQACQRDNEITFRRDGTFQEHFHTLCRGERKEWSGKWSLKSKQLLLDYDVFDAKEDPTLVTVPAAFDIEELSDTTLSYTYPDGASTTTLIWNAT